MEVVHTKDNEDGSADFTFDLTEEEASALFNAGLRQVVLEPVKHTEPQWNEAREALIKLGVITGIVNGIQEREKEQASASAEQ